jgi:hypothetical protein
MAVNVRPKVAGDANVKKPLEAVVDLILRKLRLFAARSAGKRDDYREGEHHSEL